MCEIMLKLFFLKGKIIESPSTFHFNEQKQMPEMNRVKFICAMRPSNLCYHQSDKAKFFIFSAQRAGIAETEQT